jgi:hypothetical protein
MSQIFPSSLVPFAPPLRRIFLFQVSWPTDFFSFLTREDELFFLTIKKQEQPVLERELYRSCKSERCQL